jgi:hypothetical protein
MSDHQKLPPDFKAKWIAALRSGEYAQGDAYLHDLSRDTYCCLGVAAKAAGAPLELFRSCQYIPGAYHEVPACLRENSKAAILLAQMNDGRMDYRDNPQTFDQIADWIEANL